MYVLDTILAWFNIIKKYLNWISIVIPITTDSRLFVVRSQTGNSTPGPSFGHNLCFRCPNEQCEPILDIYAPRAFQWYKERHSTLRFDPCNRSLKFRKSTGTPSPKVGVALGVWVFIPSHSLTLSYTPGSMWCDSSRSSWPALLQCLCLDSRASSWLTPLQALCLGRKPKARVATLSPTRRRGQCLHWHLYFLSTIAITFFWILGHQMLTLCCRTLPQANLGVPKLPTLSWQVQGCLNRNP
jgi:hypothetical protein